MIKSLVLSSALGAHQFAPAFSSYVGVYNATIHHGVGVLRVEYTPHHPGARVDPDPFGHTAAIASGGASACPVGRACAPVVSHTPHNGAGNGNGNGGGGSGRRLLQSQLTGAIEYGIGHGDNDVFIAVTAPHGLVTSYEIAVYRNHAPPPPPPSPPPPPPPP
eukprot:CAMPEP_0182879480 /NCGR_PEP_ID=MMETSP0034_2-20130328/16003_1 /TAXON_ID=156128 /ORGANISM="Nephroselmis pyriformis, Strain CCMP717" /LENGTH=161 /DNA_ID=CAMNT_0025012423 /DNA_START=13 /DNA_END=495 /DNA_ORIENTATION=-